MLKKAAKRSHASLSKQAYAGARMQVAAPKSTMLHAICIPN